MNRDLAVWDEPGRMSSRALVNSLPKSGTHLLGSILDVIGLRYQKPVLARNVRHHPLQYIAWWDRRSCLLGIGQPHEVRSSVLRFLLDRLQPGRYRLGHIPYQECVETLLQRKNIKAFFVIRDPRDVVVSQIPYYLRHGRHYLHQAYKALDTDEKRLIAAIRGMKRSDGECITYGIAQKLNLSLGWLASPAVVALRFEDLIGARGGGDTGAQAAAIARVCEHLGMSVSTSQAIEIGQKAFGRGRTYRKGQAGGWRSWFTDEVKDVFKQEAGEYLIRMGYETGEDW